MSSDKKDSKPTSNENENECRCMSLFDKPCSYSKQLYKCGCNGCDQWEKHYCTDCGEMMFCCLPCGFIMDTIVFPFTITKYLLSKCNCKCKCNCKK